MPRLREHIGLVPFLSLMALCVAYAVYLNFKLYTSLFPFLLSFPSLMLDFLVVDSYIVV